MNRDSKIDYEKAVLAHPRKLEIAGGGLGDVGRDSLCKTRATSIGGIQSCSTLSWGRGLMPSRKTSHPTLGTEAWVGHVLFPSSFKAFLTHLMSSASGFN